MGMFDSFDINASGMTAQRFRMDIISQNVANANTTRTSDGTPYVRKVVTFTYNGNSLEGFEGEPIATALKANGVMAHRYTAKTHEPRGVFCAIGRCTDCVMIVDDMPNVRTCITPLQEGMKVQTQYGVSKEPEKEEM